MILESKIIDKRCEDSCYNNSMLFNFTVFIAYLAVLFCIYISAISITHEDLLYENNVLFKFTGISVPIKLFFVLSPCLVVVNFYILHLISKGVIALDSSFIVFINKKIYKISIINSLLQRIEQIYHYKSVQKILPAAFFIFQIICSFATLCIIIYSFLPYHSNTITYFQKFILIFFSCITLKIWKNISHCGKQSFYNPLFNFILKILVLICTLVPILMFTLPSEHKALIDFGLAVGPNVEIMANGEHRPKSKEFTPLHIEPLNNVLLNVGLLKAYTSVVRDLNLSGKTIAKDAHYRESINQILTATSDPDDQISRYAIFKPTRLQLTGRDLQGANFSGAIICNVDFDGVNLAEASFKNARVYNSTFSNTNLQNSNLMGINGNEVTFRKTNLSYSYLFDSRLQGVGFLSCDVFFSDFERADLTACDFNFCNISATNFFEAVLDGAEFLGGQLVGCEFWRASMSGVILPKMIFCCDMRSIVFTNLTTKEIRDKFYSGSNLKTIREKKYSGYSTIDNNGALATPVHCIYGEVPEKWKFPACNIALIDFIGINTSAKISASCKYPDEISNIFTNASNEDLDYMDILNNKKREIISRTRVLQKMTCGKNVPIPKYTALQLEQSINWLELQISRESEKFTKP